MIIYLIFCQSIINCELLELFDFDEYSLFVESRVVSTFSALISVERINSVSTLPPPFALQNIKVFIVKFFSSISFLRKSMVLYINCGRK